MSSRLNWHIFCEVIDNYGDIGVCWRLAKQLQQQHQQTVCLWVDDLLSFQALCPEVNPQKNEQIIEQVVIYHWQRSLPNSALQQFAQAQVVIEAFGCPLPEAHIQLMQQQRVQPCWINLEYLSAEAWAQECHLLPSPVNGMQKIYFFPGFNGHMGGLLWEPELLTLTQTMSSTVAKKQLFQTIQIEPQNAELPLQISLFAYENIQVNGLLTALNNHSGRVHLLVPQGRIQAAVESWLAENPVRMLTVSIIPFLSQPLYDQLLASCDINFVRGEESFVRAQMLGLPMLWHIYQQAEDAHTVKLEAFLNTYLVAAPPSIRELLWQAFRHWNSTAEAVFPWKELFACLSDWKLHAQHWQEQQQRHGSLSQNLVQFVQTRYSAAHFKTTK